MRKPVVVITGAGGEIGHGLIDRLAERGDRRIVTLDVSPLDASIARKVDREVTGSIVDKLMTCVGSTTISMPMAVEKILK